MALSEFLRVVEESTDQQVVGSLVDVIVYAAQRHCEKRSEKPTDFLPGCMAHDRHIPEAPEAPIVRQALTSFSSVLQVDFVDKEAAIDVVSRLKILWEQQFRALMSTNPDVKASLHFLKATSAFDLEKLRYWHDKEESAGAE
jgi:hypothetical protein